MSAQAKLYSLFADKLFNVCLKYSRTPEDAQEISLNFLLSLINKLPPQYQLIFNLYVLDEYSHKEISEILDISVGTSKSNLSRARKLLKKQIDAIKKLQL